MENEIVAAEIVQLQDTSYKWGVWFEIVFFKRRDTAT